MTTNREWLYSLDVADLSDWFDAEHVDNTRSAKRAAAVERVRKAKDAGTNIGYAIVGREYYPWEAYETLIDLLTDDGGLTNLEWLFIDSEQFRQAVSAFAFAHSDDCPTSPTQIVDWLLAEHMDDTVYQSEFTNCGKPYREGDVVLDAGIIRPIRMMDARRDINRTCPNSDEAASNHSKAQSKMEPSLTEQPESLSDANDDLAPESDVTADAVDANDGFIDLDSCTHGVRTFASETDSREKLEADARDLQSRIWDAGSRHDGISMSHIIELLDRQAAITRKTEQAAWIQQANGLIHEANVERDELRVSLDTAKQLIKQYKAAGVDNLRKIDELRDELAKRDKGIARLKRQRDEARQQISILEAECDDCVYKQEWQTMDKLEAERDEARDFLTSSENLNADLRAMNDALADDNDRLEAERDALAADLQDCEQQRERLRQALGCAIDHAHEVVSLVTLDGEVIG